MKLTLFTTGTFSLRPYHVPETMELQVLRTQRGLNGCVGLGQQLNMLKRNVARTGLNSNAVRRSNLYDVVKPQRKLSAVFMDVVYMYLLHTLNTSLRLHVHVRPRYVHQVLDKAIPRFLYVHNVSYKTGLRSYHVLAIHNTVSVGSYQVHIRFLQRPSRFIYSVLTDTSPQAKACVSII